MKRPAPKVVMAPTKPILDSADLIEEAVGSFLKAISTIKDARVYESNIEALTLGWVLVRHIESVFTLARADLVTLPSALVIARSALETAATILWLLKPASVWDREARWLAHLRGEEGYHDRLAKFLTDRGRDGAWHAEQSRSTSDFRKSVEELLPKETYRIKQIPHFRDILKDLDREDFYEYYIRLSEFVHGGSVASTLYRKNHGTAKEVREFMALR